MKYKNHKIKTKYKQYYKMNYKIKFICSDYYF